MNGESILYSIATFLGNGFTTVEIRTQIDPAKFLDITETLFRAGFSGATHVRIECEDCEYDYRNEATFWIDSTDNRAAVTVVLWWIVPAIIPQSLKVPDPPFRNHAEEIDAALAAERTPDDSHP